MMKTGLNRSLRLEPRTYGYVEAHHRQSRTVLVDLVVDLRWVFIRAQCDSRAPATLPAAPSPTERERSRLSSSIAASNVGAQRVATAGRQPTAVLVSRPGGPEWLP